MSYSDRLATLGKKINPSTEAKTGLYIAAGGIVGAMGANYVVTHPDSTVAKWISPGADGSGWWKGPLFLALLGAATRHFVGPLGLGILGAAGAYGFMSYSAVKTVHPSAANGVNAGAMARVRARVAQRPAIGVAQGRALMGESQGMNYAVRTAGVNAGAVAQVSRRLANTFR